ncbi:MAG: DUF4430 domain-containing protein [Candidatus Nomurabacteria bacterium]|nr:DUF4430 domain-containing protein [Candidatus Nomurabacteria bacterium]
MKNLNKKYIIILLIIALLALRFFIVYFKHQDKITEVQNIEIPKVIEKSTPEILKQIPVTKNIPKNETIPLNTNIVTIKVGDTNINLPIQSNASLYDVLLAGQKSGQINFTGKNYSGMGFFISSIGNLKEGYGKYLIYYVNGTEASVGISSYVPKVGDIIEWKLSTSL